MENNTVSPESSNTADNASSILGTSSDAIIEGLHKGEFLESNQGTSEGNPGDKEQIVNQQEQQRIVNPGVKDLDDDELVIPKASSAVNESGENVFRDSELEGDEEIAGNKDETESKPPVQRP